jgi:mannosyltransferase
VYNRGNQKEIFLVKDFNKQLYEISRIWHTLQFDLSNRLKKTALILEWICRHRILVSVSLCTMFGAFLRFYHIGTESFWFDETASIYSAEKSLYVMLGGCLQWHRQPPLHFAALKLWIDFFGDGEIAVRSLSALFGVGSIFLIFLIGRKLFNNKVGLIACFLSMFSYFFLQFSQEGRDYAMLVFLTLLSFYFFIRLIQAEKSSKWPAILYSAFTILMIYTHYFGLFVLAGQIFYFILVRKQQKTKEGYYWYALLFIIIAFSPWAAGFVIYSIPNSFSMGHPGLTTLMDTFKNYSGYGNTGFAVLLIFSCMCLLGLVSWKIGHDHGQKESRLIRFRFFKWTFYWEWRSLLLLIWLIFPVVIPFLISQIPTKVAGIYVSKYTISAMPAFLLLVSVGMAKFLTKKYLYPVFISLILVVTVISAIGLHGYYTTVQKEQWRESINWIQPLYQKDDVIILDPSYFYISFNYYSKGKLQLQTITDGEEIRDLNQFVFSGKKRIWLVWGPRDPSSIRDQILSAFNGQSPLLIKSFFGIQIDLYDLDTYLHSLQK